MSVNKSNQDYIANSFIFSHNLPEVKIALVTSFISLFDLYNYTRQVVYTPTSASSLLLRPPTFSEQPVLFKLHPSHASYARSILGLAQEFAWKWLVVVTEGASFFQEVKKKKKRKKKKKGVKDMKSNEGGNIHYVGKWLWTVRL